MMTSAVDLSMGTGKKIDRSTLNLSFPSSAVPSLMRAMLMQLSVSPGNRNPIDCPLTKSTPTDATCKGNVSGNVTTDDA